LATTRRDRIQLSRVRQKKSANRRAGPPLGQAFGRGHGQIFGDDGDQALVAGEPENLIDIVRRAKYGGLEVSDAKRLKALEEENRKAQKPLAGCGDAARDAGKKLLTPSSRRQAVSWAIAQKCYSQRRACGLIGLAAKTYCYRSRRPDAGDPRGRLRPLAAERRRFGVRRLLVLLRRDRRLRYP
jgi:hypothetical protein